MKLWAKLYAMIWLVFFDFLLAMTPDRWHPGWVAGAHVVLGLAVLALAFVNFSQLRGTTAPGRIKRTARSTRQLVVVMAVLGPLLAFHVGERLAVFGVTLADVLLLAHVVVAFAILTQAAATAIAFDMWEEKEWMAETPAGHVPLAPLPRAGATSRRGSL
jgi:hypothetical protein